jgi:hypothetical protein
MKIVKPLGLLAKVAALLSGLNLTGPSLAREFNLRLKTDTSGSGPAPAGRSSSASACAATARRSCSPCLPSSAPSFNSDSNSNAFSLTLE